MTVADLAPVFTLDDACAVGVRKDQVYDLLGKGEIERLGRGVYLRPFEIDPAFASLAGATALHDDATLCLTSALVYHDLSDTIPFGSDIALPRGTHLPAGFAHISWHTFDPTTFHVGRNYINAGDGITLAIYSAERTIVDCFRLMHQEGSDVAYEALRRWLPHRGNSPAALLELADSFPRAKPRIQNALEILL